MEPDKEPVPATPGGRSRILIIDQDQGFSYLLSSALELAGYAAEAAQTGEEGLERLRKAAFDVIISDEKDAFPAGRPAAFSGTGARVIAVSADGSVDRAVACVRSGAFDVIARPCAVDAVIAKVRAALAAPASSPAVAPDALLNSSHDLRSPLNAITGYTSLLLDGMYGALTEKQETALKAIRSSSSRLLSTLNNLLETAKLSAGKESLFREDISVRRMLQEVAAMMGPLAGDKNLSLAIDMEEDVLVHTDSTRLKQILINLVDNAITFTGTGGITLSAGKGSLPPLPGDASPSGEAVRIDVKDTGPGLPDATLRSLREGSAPPAAGGAPGLGLPTALRLSRLLGGTITADNLPEKGCALSVFLPAGDEGRHEKTASPASPGAAPLEADGRKTVLAIDDDPEVHRLLRDSLEGSDFVLLSALDGEEGISLARQFQPFAILLDVLMPHKDGWTVLQSLKNDPDVWSIPVIMLSVMDNRSLAFSLGVSDYLLKPFDRRALLGRLNRLVTIKKTKVLVVDDDKELNMVMQMLFTNAGYEVLSAYGGEEAIVCVERDRPDVVLLDLLMPCFDGIDVLNAVRDNPELGNIRVIVTTAKALSPEESAELHKRADLVIEKGARSIKEILALIRSTLEPGIPDR